MTSESMMVEGISPIRCSISVTCPLFRRLGVTGHCQISRSWRSYEKIRDCELSRINHKMYNIYTYLFINFAKRLGSLTEQAPLRVPEKKGKSSNTTKQNDNTLETIKKKKCKCKNRIGKDIDKKINNTSKQFNGRLVWYLIHTLFKVWGVSTS